MKFLIVNGFNATPANHKIFEQFRTLIYEITQSQKEMADIDFEYLILDRHNLENFLYEPETALIKPENGQKFDTLDVVFIIAPPNLRPWNSHMRNIVTLIRMCIKTKKLLFMTSFGAQTLAYLCASNTSAVSYNDSQHINVTNGNGEGCKLVDFPKFTMQAFKNGHDDFFVDSTTGDLYCYNKSTDEWIPKANVGLHHRRDAMEYQSIGKYVVKSPAYKPKQQIISNNMTCIIKKPFLHYWLFKGVNIEFQINQSNTWDIHTITFTNPERRFQSLAENNQRGPLILQSDNIIAILFEIDIKSKDQVLLLENFIENGIKTVRYSNSYNQISITDGKQFLSPKGLDNIELIYNGQNQKKSTHVQEDLMKSQHKAFVMEYRKLINKAILDPESQKDKILHVGFSVKKNRLPEVVEHNNILQNALKAKRRKSFFQKKEQAQKISQLYSNIDILNTNIENPQTSRRHIKVRTEPKVLMDQNMDEVDERNVLQSHRVLSQMEVRKQLHPSLEQEFLGIQKIWIPGFLKFKKSSKAVTISTQNSPRKRGSFI